MILNFPVLDYLPKRIISVVPSQTELLYSLGLEEETIGITKFCIHPDTWFKNKVRIGGTKALNIQKIIELDPDLIIANHEENVKEQIELLAEKYPVWITRVKNLDDAIKMIEDIGQLTGHKEQSKNLELKIKYEFGRLKECVAGFSSLPLRIAYFIWRDPYMTVGGDTFINDIIKRCGLKNIFEDLKRYPEISLEELREKDCELLLLSSEPYPFKEKHIGELQLKLPGVKILLANGEMFSWYGSRLLEAPNYLAGLLTEIHAFTEGEGKAGI